LSGDRDNRPFHMYGYSFGLDPKKTVRSIILPRNENAVVFGMKLVRGMSGTALRSENRVCKHGTGLFDRHEHLPISLAAS